MTKRAIIDILARERRVERFVSNTAHVSPLTDDLQDLAQMVYAILLEYDEERIVDLWEGGAINFFIARIICNQYRSGNSAFHALYRRPRERTDCIGVGTDIERLERSRETERRTEDDED